MDSILANETLVAGDRRGFVAAFHNLGENHLPEWSRVIKGKSMSFE
jgi:hypothetical protein